jgi:cytoskeletal protein CcmA (bactofilin family)
VVTVEGTVEGNLTAVEQVILRSSARVQGDILAPRVVLEDGARFRGGVDMGELPPATNTARPANVSREVTAAALQQVARETSTTDTASAGPRDEQRPPRDKPKSESPATASVPR